MHRGETTAMLGAAGGIGVRRASMPSPPLREATQSRACRSRPASVRRTVMSVVVSLVLVLAAGSGTAVHATPDPMVEAIQRALIERGFDPGKVDGAMGWRTRGAIRVFQRSIGLVDTGRTDDATLTALGLKSPVDASAQADADAPPRVEPTPVPSTEAPKDEPPNASAPDTEAPRAEPAPAPGPDASRADSQGAEPDQAPGPGAPKVDSQDSEPAPAPDPEAPEAESQGTEPAPAPDTGAPKVDSQGAEPAPAPDAEAPEAESQGTEPAPAPDTGAPKVDSQDSEPAPAPDPEAPEAESQGAEPAPASDPGAPKVDSQDTEPAAGSAVGAPETDAPRAQVPAPAPSTDAPGVIAPSPGPAATSDTDAPGTESPRGNTAQPPGAEEPEAEPAPATPDVEPSADASESESPRPKRAPKRIAGPMLKFAALGWHRPQTGEAALERFNASGAPRDFKRGTGSLFVPKSELVFVLNAGETIPGFDCDPGAARLSIEFVFGPDGPVIFNPVSDGEFCRMGIGIALEVGRTLEMRRVDWGDVQLPRGTVRITNAGLEYVE